MALWGNNDSKNASGYANISSNGFVNGTSSAFTTDAKVGDFIIMANTDYMIVSITSDTQAQVVGQFQNTSVTAQANAAYVLSEKPKYSLLDANFNIGDTNNIDLYSNYSNTVYGVDTTEKNVSNGAVREVVFSSYGSGYSANATVTVTGGLSNTVAVSANAQANSSGRITAIKFANNGAGFTSAPTLAVSAPTPLYFNGNVTSGAVVLGNATSDSTQFKLDNGYIVTSTNTAFLANGDVVTYLVQAGNTAIGGLTNNTSYSVYTINSTAIALYVNSGGANAFINLSSVGTGAQANHSFTGQTANVTAILSGVNMRGYHSGWVKRTVFTGGRAGRVQYETLVAGGTIAGDANDDNVFPDA